MPRKRDLFANAMKQHEDERKKRFKRPRREAPRIPKPKDWYDDLLKEYPNEKEMFKQFKIDEKLFDDLLGIVQDVPLIGKGRYSYFRSHKSKLMLLLLYLQLGKPSAIAMLTNPEVKTSEQILRSVKNVLETFGKCIIEDQIYFRNETFMDQYSCIVDCTIVQRKKPETTYKEALPWYSGKHGTYCFKKEVIVDIESGRCCYVSKGHPGSHHDMKILKETADEINKMVEDTKILADKGYKGSSEIVPGIVIPSSSDRDDKLRKRRVRVERYFGRLKCKFSVLSGKFPLSDDMFDITFDTCAAILNVELLRHSLKEGDENDEQNHLENLQIAEAQRRERVKQKNDKYRRKMKRIINGTQ